MSSISLPPPPPPQSDSSPCQILEAEVILRPQQNIQYISLVETINISVQIHSSPPAADQQSHYWSEVTSFLVYFLFPPHFFFSPPVCYLLVFSKDLGSKPHSSQRVWAGSLNKSRWDYGSYWKECAIFLHRAFVQHLDLGQICDTWCKASVQYFVRGTVVSFLCMALCNMFWCIYSCI